MRAFALLTVFILFSGVVFAQPEGKEPDRPQFDIADVHPSPPPTSGFVRFVTGGVVRGGRYDLLNTTMIDLIQKAYDIDPTMIQGGPIWLEMDRFDIAAKAPSLTSSVTVKLMLQSLLAERFELIVHNGVTPMPAYLLKVGAKSKLKEASAGGTAGCQYVPQKIEPGAVVPLVFACHNESMEEFAKFLRNNVPNPVVDSTDLKGGWDFDLKWYNRTQLPLAGAGAVTIFDAVDQQLGLKLDLGKTSVPVFMVDSVNETPTPNLPAVAAALPPRPLEFEVADIKLSTPDELFMTRPMPGGRVELRAITLKQIMQLAWHMLPDMIVGNTKGIESTKFDVIAKTSSVTTPNQYDEDDIEAMERTMLTDRFKLKVHLEERPYPAYTLLAVKPKLTKADPSNRTGCKESTAVANDPRDANPARSRLVICRNITMAEFVVQLQRFSGYTGLIVPVLDSTGIEGRFDFTLNFSTDYFIQMSGHSSPPANGAQPGSTPAAADPGGGLSLFDALSKQLGLKLELQKRPIPLLVIDSVEEKPTEN